MAKKIGFYIGHGVEIRHFILSGLYKEAQRQGETIIYRKENNNSIFLNEYLGNANVIYLDNIKIKKRHPIEAINTSLRSARLRLKKIGNFHHYNKSKNLNLFRDFILGNVVIFYIFNLVALIFLKKHYSTPALTDEFLKSNLGSIFIVDYNDPYYLQIGYAANAADVNVKIIINSLKSYYINDFIPFKAKRVYTWNDNQNKLFKQSNFHQKKATFSAIGNPFHNFIFSTIKSFTIDEELKKLEHVPFIVYSLIYEKVYAEEFNILLLLNEFINNSFPLDKPKIVIRRNPFEESQMHIEKIRKLNNVVIAPHSWERDAARSWSIQSIKGETEWKYLLSKAHLLINITSMAAVESILSGTPVINIGFNGKGEEEPPLSRFTNAPFQQDIQISNFILSTSSFSEFKVIFFELYNTKAILEKKVIMNSMNISLINNEVIKNMIND